MTLIEMRDGLIAGKELAFPVPANAVGREDFARLRSLLVDAGYEIPTWPKVNHEGTHYWIRATRAGYNQERR